MRGERQLRQPWLRPDWHDDALCVKVRTTATGEQVEWFPERGQPTGPAKDVCAVCPVCRECLAYAIEAHETFGIFGCSSERQRRRLRPLVTRTRPLESVVNRFWQTEVLKRRRQLAAADVDVEAS